jgi:hypothetical protein
VPVVVKQRGEYDPQRLVPYKTGELATIFGVNRTTIIKWVEAGRFGKLGRDWKWTAAGPGKGDRIVSARAVRRVIERGL